MNALSKLKPVMKRGGITAIGGLRIAFQSLDESFISSGCNLAILYRLMAIAAGSLDTLPHSSGLFLIFAYFGLTHKEAYKHYFWISVAIPAVVAIVATFVCVAFGF